MDAGPAKKHLAYRFGSLGRRVRGPVLKIHSLFESRHLCPGGSGTEYGWKWIKGEAGGYCSQRTGDGAIHDRCAPQARFPITYLLHIPNWVPA
jgi:hypothetical protein